MHAEGIREQHLAPLSAPQLHGRRFDAVSSRSPSVSNHLACLRWCGFVEARREHRLVYNRIADARVVRLIELARALLEDNEEHVASCRRA